MYAFFYSLYIALFSGSWVVYSGTEAQTALSTAWSDLTNFVMNTLGGEFAAVQDFSWTAEPETLWASTLAIITLSLVAVIAYRLVKLVFSIFFAGGRL